MVVEDDSNLFLSHHFGVVMLVKHDWECNDRNTSSDKLEATAETTVGQTCLQGWMCEYFDLRNPWFDPEFIVFLRDLKALERPDDSASDFLETLIHDLDFPFSPSCEGPNGNKDDLFALSVCVVHPIAQLWIFLLE